jgi:hypothetical protein
MRFSLDNFLYAIKQLVTGKNGDDTPVAGTLLAGNNAAGVSSSAASADGGIKVDQIVPLADTALASSFPAITDSTGGTTTTPGTFAVVTLPPTLTDSTGGTANTTFAAITAGSSYAQADMVAVKNALAQVVLDEAATSAALASIRNTLAKAALIFNAANSSGGMTVSSVPVIATPAGTNPPIGTFSFAIPRDYDEASDHLSIFVEANSTNADAAITLTGTATVAPIASQLTTSTAIVAVTETAVTATAPFTAAALNVKQNVQVFALNFSGYGLKRNDIVSVALAYAGTTTGTDYVYSVFRHYDSTIVSYNDTDATGNPSTSGIPGVSTVIQPGFGNALR